MKRRINITIDEMILKIIDDYARDNGLSRSAAITILILQNDKRLNLKIGRNAER